MKVLKKTLSVILSIVLWLIILLAGLYAFTTLATRDDTAVSNLAGYTPMIVETDSMSPTFESGDLIFIKTCDPSKLEEGDIITFHTIIDNEYALNTHRIVEINDADGVRSYVTKGDNNDVSDTHIIADGDIVGKYVGKLSKLGKVMDLLSSSAGFLIILVLPMLLFFIYQVYHLIMVSINLKKAIAAEEAAKQAERQMQLEEKEKSEVPPADQNGSETPAADRSTADETQKMMAEAERIKAEAEAMKAQAEAEAALAEAKRLKAEAEAQLAQVKNQQEDEEK
jgi:signal peptidase